MKWLIILLFLNFTYAIDDCKDTSDCEYQNLCISNQCIHKGILPIGINDVVGIVLISIISALANAAGIGGGILSIMILQSIMYFDTYYAVPMAQVISFGGSLISVLLKLRLRHPTRDRPLIDYELIIYILSPILGGTTIGVILHLIFPNWLTITLLSALSGYMCWVTTKKGISMFKKENSYKNLANTEKKNAVAPERVIRKVKQM